MSPVLSLDRFLCTRSRCDDPEVHTAVVNNRHNRPVQELQRSEPPRPSVTFTYALSFPAYLSRRTVFDTGSLLIWGRTERREGGQRTTTEGNLFGLVFGLPVLGRPRVCAQSEGPVSRPTSYLPRPPRLSLIVRFDEIIIQLGVLRR